MMRYGYKVLIPLSYCDESMGLKSFNIVFHPDNRLRLVYHIGELVEAHKDTMGIFVFLTYEDAAAMITVSSNFFAIRPCEIYGKLRQRRFVIKSNEEVFTAPDDWVIERYKGIRNMGRNMRTNPFLEWAPRGTYTCDAIRLLPKETV